MIDKKPGNDDIDALLPWFVNDTLEPEEAARVRGAAREDIGTRRKVRELAALKGAMGGEPRSDVDPHAALQTLMSKINAAETRRRRVRDGLLWGGVTAACAALAVALWTAPGNDVASRAPGYEVLNPPPAAATGDLRVIFESTLDDPGRHAVAERFGLEIVSGPDGSGVYGLAAVNPAADVEGLRDALMASGEVRFAERAGRSEAP